MIAVTQLPQITRDAENVVPVHAHTWNKLRLMQRSFV